MAHDYNSFASVYDLVMGARVDEAKFLKSLIELYAPRARTVLELGCGSGSLIKVLEKTYSCVGIDLSSEMVKVARKKVPNSEFIVGDITSFDLEEKFDVVICAFDTINHVTSFNKWKQIFNRAHSHLNPGGVFIFDMNTQFKMERFATEMSFAEITDGLITIVGAEKKGPNRFELDVKGLVKNESDSFDLHEIKIPEITFPVAKVKSELKKYFRTIELYDADRAKPSAKTEELYFICSRAK